MPDFKNHADVLILLSKAQDADEDNRDRAREAHLFVSKKDGQWEPYWWDQNVDHPRYTFDMTSPIVDSISGEMMQADFDININPGGGDTTKEDAQLIDGMIRSIENISRAEDIYNQAGRNMVIAGLDGWMIKQEYVDDDSFDQDLVIKRIANFIDSVWFGPHSEPDASDARYGFVLEGIDIDIYNERYPEGSGQSVGEGRSAQAYHDKREQVVIGNIYYIKTVNRELLLTSSGRVLEASEAEPILDELAEAGETIVDRRTRPKNIVKSRLFDGSGWLGDEQETVFGHVPIIPCIGNFNVFENKILYHGAVEKQMDPQRVFNYVKCREVEEGALSPRPKYWMTKKQAAGHEDTLETLNTNADPVQFYNVDSQAPGAPQQSGGVAVNAGLSTLGNDMMGLINQTSGLFDANRGRGLEGQSGVAIEKLQNKGDTGTIKWFKAIERAKCQTAKILIDAIPAVYSSERQVRVLKQDNTSDIVTVNQPIMDRQTGRMITANDLSIGKYDVTCSAGPSFQNKQQETVSAFMEIAAIDPSSIQLGGDILFKNITSPGMDLIAERLRQRLFNAGEIPESQMTDEEKQEMLIRQQQPPPPPDPVQLLAEAEINKAEAQAEKVRVDAFAAQSRETRENEKFNVDIQKTQVEIEQKEQKIAQDQQMIDIAEFKAMQETQIAQNQMIVGLQKTLAETAKLIRESAGAGMIVGPGVVETFKQSFDQIDQVQKTQDL